MRFALLLITIFTLSCTTGNKRETSLPKVYNLGSEINYKVVGDGDTTLFFVHGWCINQSYWDAQVDHFEKRYKVVTIDLPGHGNSDKNRKDWTIENFGKDVILLIEALQLKNIVLVGHSMGGSIILEAAIAKPEVVIGFVGVDNFKDLAVVYDEQQLEDMEAFINQLKTDYESAVKGFAQGMLFAESTPKKVSDRVLSDILEIPPKISVDILESLSTHNEIEGRQMQQLQHKVHLINCDGYPTNTKQLQRYCTNSYAVHSIGDVGHYPMVEEAEKFNMILDGILWSL